MSRIRVYRALLLLLTFVLALLAGCGGSSAPVPDPAPLNDANLNLIFVVSEDLAFQAPGDINPATANLTSCGLQRSLLMGTFLQQKVLGGSNVSAIYAIEPMTHLQTDSNYPDLVPLETIQQFAMLNQTSITYQGVTAAANSFPVFASYAPDSVPMGVAKPAYACDACIGLDLLDQLGDNETLISGIVTANAPGFYVFSAPWETPRALMADVNQLEGSNLTLPTRYAGPNVVYAISITTSGNASPLTYNSNVIPPPTYPVLPTPGIVTSQCTAPPFQIQVTGGAGAPANSNINETVYMIRHAETHPTASWDDGNYVGPGQWRALQLPYALLDKIHPTEVYSIDPANAIPGGGGSIPSSYIRPSMTAEPCAIFNNLPFNLAASVAVFMQNPPELSTMASNFFFTNGMFSNKTILVAWEHDHIPPTVNALISTYQTPPSRIAPNSSDSDYDTIWTVKLDARGNLSVDNSLCEGIDSASLPATPPQF